MQLRQQYYQPPLNPRTRRTLEKKNLIFEKSLLFLSRLSIIYNYKKLIFTSKKY